MRFLNDPTAGMPQPEVNVPENLPEMQARATLAPQMYFCVEVVRKLFTDKPSKDSVRRKN